jgi:hypothetical protein
MTETAEKQHLTEKEHLEDYGLPISLHHLSNGNVEVLLPPRFEHLLNGAGEDNPALLICWDDENFVVWNEYFPIDGHQLQAAFAGYVAAFGGGNVGNCLITPNTVYQYAQLYTMLSNIGLDPYIIQLHNTAPLNLPLARLFTLADRSAQILLLEFKL